MWLCKLIGYHRKQNNTQNNYSTIISLTMYSISETSEQIGCCNIMVNWATSSSLCRCRPASGGVPVPDAVHGLPRRWRLADQAPDHQELRHRGGSGHHPVRQESPEVEAERRRGSNQRRIMVIIYCPVKPTLRLVYHFCLPYTCSHFPSYSRQYEHLRQKAIINFDTNYIAFAFMSF